MLEKFYWSNELNNLKILSLTPLASGSPPLGGKVIKFMAAIHVSHSVQIYE